MPQNKSTKIFIGLIILYSLTAAIGIFLPYGALGPSPADYQNFPIPRSLLALANAGLVFIIYGLLGFIGLKLSRKIGFPNIWDERVNNKQRFLIPALIGVLGGIILIIGDLIFYKINTIGHFPHPDFPASLNASLAAGIGEEIIFRLFFISFWVWLISFVIFKKKWQKQIFWIVAIISALAFAIGHFPSLMYMFGFKSLADFPLALQTEIILLNGIISIFAAYYFRKYGFLAAVGIHFWTDVIWHVIYGFFV